jgi:hypothetical protein
MIEQDNLQDNTAEPEYSEDFLKGSPTREEVNQYMNNVYMAVNNSVGLYQGYMVSALVDTLIDTLAANGIAIEKDKFMAEFLRRNGEFAKIANEKMREMSDEDLISPDAQPMPAPSVPAPEIKLI